MGALLHQQLELSHTGSLANSWTQGSLPCLAHPTFPAHLTEPRAQPCGPLLSCWCGAEGPILGSLHCQKCHPPCPEDSQTSSYSCKQGHPKSGGLLAEVRHQDLALRTDICKSVFLFLLPLCFSNKDKATRKKGTWNSVKNTQKGSTKSQITNKTNKQTKKKPWTQRQRG